MLVSNIVLSLHQQKSIIMNLARYTFLENGIINDIVLGFSTNTKLSDGSALMIQTYHFSLDQVLSKDFTSDKDNCKDCPFSYNMNNGKTGGCYTHKGTMKMGLIAKIKSLNTKLSKGQIKEFSTSDFAKFYNKAKKYSTAISLVRFGAYGEPTLLNIDVITELAKLGTHNGYTHQWHKISKDYAKYFMASVETTIEAAIAKDLGYRSFIVSTKIIDGVNCPASKESNKKSSCAKCKLCGGTSGKSTKDIYILKH